MAKKGNRIQVILECTEHKKTGLPGTSRYITTKNKKNTPDRIELKKYNPIMKKMTIHKEIKQKDMAKKTVASLQKKGAKAFTKAIKMVKTDTGSYSFKSEIVPKDKVKDFFAKKQYILLYNLKGFFLFLEEAFFLKHISYGNI